MQEKSAPTTHNCLLFYCRLSKDHKNPQLVITVKKKKKKKTKQRTVEGQLETAGLINPKFNKRKQIKFSL